MVRYQVSQTRVVASRLATRRYPNRYTAGLLPLSPGTRLGVYEVTE